MKQKLQDKLYDYSRRNNTEGVKAVLGEAENVGLDLDLTYKDGVYFDFLFQEYNPEIFNALLNYYEGRYQSDTLDYNIHKYQLKQILERKLDSWSHYQHISLEIQLILDKYIGSKEGSESSTESSNLEGEIEVDSSISTNDSHDEIESGTPPSSCPLTEENLRKFNQEIANNTNEDWHTHGISLTGDTM